MFGIGMPEMLLICAIALIVIGPKKLPDLAKSIGRAFGEFKRATSDLKESLEIDTDLSDVTKPMDEIAEDIKGSFDAPSVQTKDQETGEPKSAPPHQDDLKTTQPAGDTSDSPDTALQGDPPSVEGTEEDDRL